MLSLGIIFSYLMQNNYFEIEHEMFITNNKSLID